MAGKPIGGPRVAFFGEKPLAEKCLEDLSSRNCEIVAVCTREKDEKVWWGKNRIKEIAHQLHLPLIKRADLLKLKPDILISVLYPFIIEKEIIHSAQRAFNLHLAPLPEYKGCNTGSHALMKGDARFGVTFHEMTEELDSGRLVEKRYFPLSFSDTARNLYDKANQTGWEIWQNKIEGILSNQSELSEVEDDGSKPFARDSLNDKKIPSTMSRLEIYNFVRALDFDPFEAAYFLNGDEKIHLRQKDFNSQTLKLNDPSLEYKLLSYTERRL
jgi:methionyl-tRNA formyltransferase